jgi:hypothetical protein
MAGNDLEILMPRAAVAVFVLDAGIGEPDVPIVVRQLVFPCPAGNLLRLTVRPTVAVLLAAIALVEESLIVALQLVVEDDAPNPTALATETLLGALVGAVYVGIVRQLSWLPQARPERLTGLVRAAVALVSVRFEKISRPLPVRSVCAPAPLSQIREETASDPTYDLRGRVLPASCSCRPIV